MVIAVKEVINDKIDELSNIKELNKYKFTSLDIKYIDKKGMRFIKEEVYDIVKKRIAYEISFYKHTNLAKRGNPIGKAQMATGCCCRDCLYKYHGVTKKKMLSNKEIRYIALLIMTWIEREYNNYNKEL